MEALNTKSSPKQEYTFSDGDFQKISTFAKARFGLDLQPSKKPLVYSRVSKRLRALKLDCFSEYCALLQSDQLDQEVNHLLSALTTNVTQFFREKHHFEYLIDKVAPQLIQRAQSGETVRIWSAARSAGQEAYCIAAALLTVAPRAIDLDIRILATDIDPRMIAQAKCGQYSLEQRTAIPEKFRQLMLRKPASPDHLEMSEEVKSLISFAELNLIDDWPMRRKFDVIFCRNAAIYFDKATQARLWSRFADALISGGHLMIGHSERLNGAAETQFQSVGITTYAKQTTAAKQTRQSTEESKS